jgi:hypothetical protein
MISTGLGIRYTTTTSMRLTYPINIMKKIFLLQTPYWETVKKNLLQSRSRKNRDFS